MLVQAVGKKGSGGSAPVIDELNVTPSTSAQVITAPSGTDGYSPVNVSAVDATIDSNIAAGNIKSGVSILGVSGSVVELNGTTTTINPSTSSQTVSPTSPNNGFTSVTVPAVTSSIDANIVAGNIKNGVTILGVTGDYQGTTPTGTLPITGNGVYNVANYASADVQVPTTAPDYYRVYNLSSGTINKSASLLNTTTGITSLSNYVFYGAMAGLTSFGTVNIDLSGLTTITTNYVFARMLEGASSGTVNIDLSKVETITGSNVFYYLTNATGSRNLIINVDLSSLKTVTGGTCFDRAFSYINKSAGNEQDWSFPELETVSGGFSYMFSNNANIKSFTADKLKTLSTSSSVVYLGTQMFGNATSLKTASFNKLNSLSTRFASSANNSPFYGCTNLENVYFGGFTASTFSSEVNYLQYLFGTTSGSAATGGCTVHFPSNFDPTNPDKTFDITTLTGYPTFGGNANYIHLAYDLPATE